MVNLSHPLEIHNFLMAEIPTDQQFSFLDVGIGFGILGYLTRRLRKPSLLVGVDIEPSYLETCKKHHIYDFLVLASASNLPFRDKIFDYVMATEIIEHLSKRQGERMLMQLRSLCTRKIIVTTPNGYMKQQPSDAPRSETHKSGWSARELRSCGYRVRGIGLRGTHKLRSERSLMIYGLLSFVSTPISFFVPELSGYIVAVKEI